jgi:hypothetical protein
VKKALDFLFALSLAASLAAGARLLVYWTAGA